MSKDRGGSVWEEQQSESVLEADRELHAARAEVGQWDTQVTWGSRC